jgi:hypothetical protein
LGDLFLGVIQTKEFLCAELESLEDIECGVIVDYETTPIVVG